MSNPALDAYRAQTTEAQMTSSITDLVEALGGAWGHLRDSRGFAMEGVPDLIVCAPPVLGLLELKRVTGKPSPAQVRWLSLLARCDRLVTGLVRPLPVGEDYGLDEVLALLRGEP
jgi:hypothetical protein